MSDTIHVPDRTMRRIVELATLAPSVHNTQPWRWRAADDRLELRADRRQQLPATDPTGRDLVISCGAALHQAEVAAAALGWRAYVDRFPDPSDPDLLARLDLAPAPPPGNAAGELEAIAHRCTDRRRFTSWPVPDERLDQLAHIASQWGTRAVALTGVSERFRAERLVLRATVLQQSVPAMALEEAAWRDRSRVDGIPGAVLPSSTATPRAHPHRFAGGDLEETGERTVEGSDGLIVLFDVHDDHHAWLRAGEGLSAMWLAATTAGLSVVPLSQVVELPETRVAFRHEVLGGLAHPLLLARVGWQAIGRGDLVRTPRRALEAVLDLDPGQVR
ncbi:Acg family FMN-binding oxidoreductase [Nocardioides currus]|uniref:NAD(P)H nitroreductase n=1 Tax=Nocardioides currus TaxID=2133958 RepID=A0A2R7YSU9_9ACTN|nr:nitroreductase family protein [Nocardioides currus]PUA79334.1 NAD(P)H nitroreductase [Nocardioides currus]